VTAHIYIYIYIYKHKHDRIPEKYQGCSLGIYIAGGKGEKRDKQTDRQIDRQTD
jgi:hypothetical protein